MINDLIGRMGPECYARTFLDHLPFQDVINLSRSCKDAQRQHAHVLLEDRVRFLLREARAIGYDTAHFPLDAERLVNGTTVRQVYSTLKRIYRLAPRIQLWIQPMDSYVESAHLGSMLSMMRNGRLVVDASMLLKGRGSGVCGSVCEPRIHLRIDGLSIPIHMSRQQMKRLRIYSFVNLAERTTGVNFHLGAYNLYHFSMDLLQFYNEHFSEQRMVEETLGKRPRVSEVRPTV